MTEFKHRYEETICPCCGWDLTLDESVRVEGRDNDGTDLGTGLTSLAADGTLQNDSRDFLVEGKHAGTECAECAERLDHLEIEE